MWEMWKYMRDNWRRPHPFAVCEATISRICTFRSAFSSPPIAPRFTFYQEYQSSRVLAGFKDLLPSSCIVVRDGQPARMPAAALTVGDLIRLEAGVRVPADMRVVQSAGLRIDKSMLTGEAEPVAVKAEPAGANTVMLEAPNMAFSEWGDGNGTCY